ncbi:tyrosine-type recombinase/integrase [Curtobacterium sp. MCBD17_035]|uniref:tyrosine-type recombinase/integrase n=1 Tax=Curtobacterium sp. MCBD17_035 TaxID=2175673 RepID=UPI000DA8C185|nr:tyrosine-type recombinase/integrase [Curtobacterium sp. MCBD17_035]WIB68083.1 tyrosine-type recombinase/integrase [Curtobacterium sp. MCBD17_035]
MTAAGQELLPETTNVVPLRPFDTSRTRNSGTGMWTASGSHDVVEMAWMPVLTLFESYERAQGFADRTIEVRRAMLLALARATRKPPAEITATDLMMRMGRGIAPASMQRERADLQAFFRWVKASKLVKKDPAKDLPKVRVPKGRPRPMTLEQVEAMLNSGVYFRTRVMIMLGLYQGLRAHEIAKFRGEHIDLTASTLFVRGKGGKDRTIPLHPAIREVAKAMPDGYWFPGRGPNAGSHITYRSVSDLMTGAIRKAGITDPRITGHSLRHTYGTELVDAGVSIRVVQEMLRHDSLASTQIYTAVSSKRLQEAVLLMPTVSVPVTSARKR